MSEKVLYHARKTLHEFIKNGECSWVDARNMLRAVHELVGVVSDLPETHVTLVVDEKPEVIFHWHTDQYDIQLTSAEAFVLAYGKNNVTGQFVEGSSELLARNIKTVTTNA